MVFILKSSYKLYKLEREFMSNYNKYLMKELDKEVLGDTDYNSNK